MLARRLVEAGVPFVTLYDGGWDHHSDIFSGLPKKLPPFENAIAALIEDLEARGLLETTLVVALGEFGRTPKISSLPIAATPGRDHWSNAMSVLFAGGGTPGGQVVGATDRNGHAACERILSPENFVATVYRKLGIDPGQDLSHPARPAGAPGQRSDADFRTDGLIQRDNRAGNARCPAAMIFAATQLRAVDPASHVLDLCHVSPRRRPGRRSRVCFPPAASVARRSK